MKKLMIFFHNTESFILSNGVLKRIYTEIPVSEVKEFKQAVSKIEGAYYKSIVKKKITNSLDLLENFFK